MKDIPIIFSAPMVRALLEGRKTMTRRLAFQKPRVAIKVGDDPAEPVMVPSAWQKVRPGDRLWVRENFTVQQVNRRWQMISGRSEEILSACVDYEADGLRVWLEMAAYAMPKVLRQRRNRKGSDSAAMSPNIHLPQMASRLTLVVTATKIERLQDIRAADSIAEGVECATCVAMGSSACQRLGCFASQAAFAELWRRLHGADSWDANPEVVAISFEVHRRNVTAMARAAA